MFNDIVYNSHIRMIQRGQKFGLTPESRLCRFICENVLRHHLNGHEAIQASILGLINDSHTPLANDLNNLESAYLMTHKIKRCCLLLEITRIRTAEDIEQRVHLC